MAATLVTEGTVGLCEFARTADLAQVLDRATDVFRPIIAEEKQPPAYLIDAVCAAGDRWLVALAGNAKATTRCPELRQRVAATGRAVLAPVVLKETQWTLADRRALLAAASPTADSGWINGPGGDVLAKLRRATDVGVLRALVVSPFPQLVLRALETVPELTRAEQLRALLSLHVQNGPTALTKTLKKPAVRVRLRAGVVELATAAITEPDGVARLRAAVTEAESTSGAIDELYRDPWRAAEILSLRAELDWTALQSAHVADPFQAKAADALAERPDCPAEMLRALYRDDSPEDSSSTADTRPSRQARPDTDLTGPARLAEEHLFHLRPATRPDTDLTGPARLAEEHLFHLRPATTVLDLARQNSGPGRLADDGAAEAGWAAFRDGLAELVTTTLGADPRAWRRLRERLPRAKGTVAEVLTEATATAGGCAPVDDPWPGAASCPPPGGIPPKRDPHRMAFLAVLNAAPVEVQLGLLPQLDDRTAYDLLVLGDWRAEWTTFAEPNAPVRERMLLARRPNLPADLIQRLAELDDPAVNAGLVYQRRATWDQRRALVAGVPFGTSTTERLPIDTAFRESILGISAAAAFATGSLKTGRKKEHLAPMVGCGEPELVTHLFDNVPLNSRNLQLRLLLGIWEHSGRDQVGQVMPDWFQDKLRVFVGELLTADDPDKALEQLREAVYAEAAPNQLVRRLRTSGRNLAWLLAEGYRWDWQVIVDEHRRKAFAVEVLEDLCVLPECPDELRRDLVRNHRAERRADFEKRLAAREAATTAAPARDGTHSGGPLPPADVRRLGNEHPPADVRLDRLSAQEVIRLAQHEPQLQPGIQALVSHHLNGNPDAWVLAIRLLPDFSGSLPELFATTSAAVS